MKSHQTLLLTIVGLNLISTWLHYTDNAIFLDRYAGPTWFTTVGVFATVILMTPMQSQASHSSFLSCGPA